LSQTRPIPVENFIFHARIVTELSCCGVWEVTGVSTCTIPVSKLGGSADNIAVVSAGFDSRLIRRRFTCIRACSIGIEVLIRLARIVAVVEVKFFSFSVGELTLSRTSSIPVEVFAFSAIVVAEILASVGCDSEWSVAFR